MKIIIENVKFPYDIGVRLLKLKYEACPFRDIGDIWNEIKPITFKEIAAFENLEHRRVGVLCLGLERLVKEAKPVLVDRQTLKKKTSFVNTEGEVVTKRFEDTYELYKVEGNYFTKPTDKNWQQRVEDSYFIKCKDTSTAREYFIWIEPRSVYSTNCIKETTRYNYDIGKINAIQCIAWTIQTNVPVGNIEKIMRQGDCVLIKPKVMGGFLKEPRHLTEKEYKTLLVAES
jgi:hypothetical protein